MAGKEKAKARFIMSWGRKYQTDGKLVSLRMKRFIGERAKPLFYHPQGMGNYFTYREAIDILGWEHTDVYKGGRIDLDPADWSDLGWMCSYIGPPASAVEEMKRRCVPENFGPYPPDLLSELRDLAAEVKFGRPRGDDFEVIGVEGAQGGIGYTYLTYLNPGDEVLMPDPVYFHFAPAALMAGATPVQIPLGPHNDYRLKPDEIRKHINLRTKMIVICDPINPFGTIQSKQELIDIVNMARENDILVFNNITHNTHQLDPKATQYPIASLYKEVDTSNVISTSGVSKGYGMAALRLGFLAGHPDLLKAAAMMKMEITKIHTNLLAQYGALAALKDHEYVVNSARVMRRNLAHVVASAKTWNERGYNVTIPVLPKFGFSMVLDISKTGVTAQELCVALFKRHVALYAGDGLGEVGASTTIRINLSRPDLWAYEKLRDEMIPSIEEARTGVYANKIIEFFEEGQTDRGLRIAAETRALQHRRKAVRQAAD
jgi:aspartate/methionine/tyrosine aminotransferase